MEKRSLKGAPGRLRPGCPFAAGERKAKRMKIAVFYEHLMEAARQIAVRCGYYIVCADSYLPNGVCFYPLEGYENRRHFYACLRKGEPVAHYVDALIRMVGEV